MDLGYKYPEPSEVPTPIDKKTKNYPSFSCYEGPATKLFGKYDVGEEVTGTVKFKVTRKEVREREGREKSGDVGVSVISFEPDEKPDKKSEKEALGYNRKVTKKEVPKLSAADLQS